MSYAEHFLKLTAKIVKKCSLRAEVIDFAIGMHSNVWLQMHDVTSRVGRGIMKNEYFNFTTQTTSIH